MNRRHPAYVEVALLQDGTWVVGNDTDPLPVDLHPAPVDFDGDGEDNYFIKEAAQLDLVPGYFKLVP